MKIRPAYLILGQSENNDSGRAVRDWHLLKPLLMSVMLVQLLKISSGIVESDKQLLNTELN